MSWQRITLHMYAHVCLCDLHDVERVDMCDCERYDVAQVDMGDTNDVAQVDMVARMVLHRSKCLTSDLSLSISPYLSLSLSLLCAGGGQCAGGRAPRAAGRAVRRHGVGLRVERVARVVSNVVGWWVGGSMGCRLLGSCWRTLHVVFAQCDVVYDQYDVLYDQYMM